MKRAICLLLLTFSLPGFAGTQSEVWVDVTRVEPVIKTQSLPSNDPACHQPKPHKREGLVALLRWDLLPDCKARLRRMTTHYRVYYEWAGREFDYVTQTLPKNKVRLNVGVEPF